jgi:3-oxoacyl-[acyl-carrier protein] reductase
MREIRGKWALVTGAASGIGRAIALRLAQEGAHLFLVDIDDAGLASVVEEARQAGVQVIGRRCDVAEPREVSAAVAEVLARCGGVDILVNNAGITRDNLLMRLKDDDWDAVLAANLKAAFVATRAVSRGMMKRRWGRIINVASVVGIVGNKGQANYAASKAGLIGFTKSVAKELASRNILANVVAPGFIETDMTAQMTQEARDALSKQIPLERLGKPNDIAGVVAFLASEHASYITGQVFVVDGGMVM